MKDQIISNAFNSVQATIEQRKTAKVLANEPWKPTLDKEEQNELISQLLHLAAHAPYHYKSAERYKQDDAARPLGRCWMQPPAENWLNSSRIHNLLPGRF